MNFICNRCKEEHDLSQLNQLILDGTEDFYSVNLCNKCNEIMTRDYYSPEEVDIMMGE